MRRLKYVLQSAIACFVVAGAMLVLFWGAGIYNIYQESHGNISDLSELWSYISEQGLIFLIGLLASVSFLVSGFQAKKASEADRAANSGREYDGVGYDATDTYGYSGMTNTTDEYGYSGVANGADTYGYTGMTNGADLYENSRMDGERYANADSGNLQKTDNYGMTGDPQFTNTYSLQSGARKISFDLPQRYRLIDGDDGDPAFAGFNEELKPELVYCSLQEAIDDETAEDYVLDELVEDEACPKELRTRAFLKQEVIEGRLYYYYIFKYKRSRKQRQKFAAACDIGGGLFYTIETEWIWRNEELTLEALMDFLKIRVE